MKHRVYISKVYSLSADIEATSMEEAIKLAEGGDEGTDREIFTNLVKVESWAEWSERLYRRF